LLCSRVDAEVFRSAVLPTIATRNGRRAGRGTYTQN